MWQESRTRRREEVARGHGDVDFALLYMRDYLREHAASLIAEDFDSQ